ncbi:cell envelope biogenesis protein LolA [Chitinophaga caeni]|uniref:Cell envelope biogenesis protein LolA n=1 Tax=Chitinophaga caeni TaxID=2029983 RepID=A0A291QUG1_9BACT|nr:outer membrane lipoprotein carrier protein LolA [Chitinophaga caeni]ATL47600.1 cell envelope biogenesis protein LolA [Chitinophaga caeni]
MRKIILMLMLGLLGGLTVQAQQYKELANPAAFRETFSKAAQQIKTIQSDFVQEKELSMLADKITSKGKFWFKQADKVKMEYLQPTYYLVIINGKNIKIKDSKQVSKVSTSQSKIFQKISKITADCVQGNILNSSSFTSKVQENNLFYKVVLTPKDKDIATYFSNIELLVDKKDYSVSKIVMQDTSGDHTTMTFIHKSLNVPLADEVFSVN